MVAAFDAPKQTQSYQDAGSLEQNNGIKEGRTLNYIENSLVAPHQISQTISTGLVVLYEYARLMIFPNELSFYYGYATIETTNLNNPKVWLSLLFYVLLVIIAYWQRNKNVVIAIGIAWYVVCILLFSNGVELVAGMVGERLAFTASAGFCMLLAGVFTALQPGFNWLKPKFAEFVVLLSLVLFSIKAVARNGEWKDAITLMTHDIKHLDNSAQAHNLLALNLLYVASNEKDNNKAVEMVQTAITHLEKSVSIYPYFFNTNFDLAKAYFSLSDFNQAKKYLEKSLQLQPQNLLGLELMVMTSYNLQLLTETEYYANQFISQNHDNLNIHQLLVNAMVITGNKEKAIIYANRALTYFPKEATLLKMLTDAKAL
jgi:tetratricopeptide (TPR) repeat protein